MEALRPIWDFFLAHAYVTVFAVTVIDASGTPFPGRLFLIAAGAFAAGGGADVTAIVAAAALGAVVGDHIWYVLGAFGRGRLLRWYCKVSLGSGRCVDRARESFQRYGPATIALGRWMAAIRIFSVPLAAASGIRYPQFLLWDVAGAIAWAGALVLLGYALGDRWPAMVERHRGSTALLVGTLVVAVAAVVGWRLWRRRRHGPADLRR
jgi:membrane-associated protein